MPLSDFARAELHDDNLQNGEAAPLHRCARRKCSLFIVAEQVNSDRHEIQSRGIEGLGQHRGVVIAVRAMHPHTHGSSCQQPQRVTAVKPSRQIPLINYNRLPAVRPSVDGPIHDASPPTTLCLSFTTYLNGIPDKTCVAHCGVVLVSAYSIPPLFSRR